MAADGYEKNGDGTHCFSCYLRWYDTVTTTRSQRFDGMLPCMNFVATRSIFDSFEASMTAATALLNALLSRELRLRGCASHEVNGL